MQLKVGKVLLAVLWEFFARPLNEVTSLYKSQATVWAKLLVILASPLLFIWFAAFQAPEGAGDLGVHSLTWRSSASVGVGTQNTSNLTPRLRSVAVCVAARHPLVHGFRPAAERWEMGTVPKVR